MVKFFNKMIQIFINFLVFIITVFIFFILYSLIMVKVFDNKYAAPMGFTCFEVASASMAPSINVKDLIVVKITNKINKGDVITYISDDDYITHRVTNIDNDVIYTKGDANNTEDVNIGYDDLLGKVILVIPKGGIIRDILFTPKVIISVIVFLILFSLCFSYVPKRKRKKVDSLDNEFIDVSNVISKRDGD